MYVAVRCSFYGERQPVNMYVAVRCSFYGERQPVNMYVAVRCSFYGERQPVNYKHVCSSVKEKDHEGLHNIKPLCLRPMASNVRLHALNVHS